MRVEMELQGPADRSQWIQFEVENLLLRGDPVLLVDWLHKEQLTNSTLTRLDQVVTKELCAGAFSRVLVVLRSLVILSENKDDQLSVRLMPKVLLWFEVVRDALTSDLHRSSVPLHCLTDRFLDYFLLLAESSLPVSQLSVLLQLLVRLSLDEGVHFPLRLEAIRTFNSILESLSREQRRAVQQDQNQNQNQNHIMSQVFAAVVTAGDYELQVSLSEALCRLTPARHRREQANHWFSSSDLTDAFCDIRDADFEVDCRHFLNFVNSYHGDQRRVYTFTCLRAFIDDTQLFRPKDEKLDEFWVDFNLDSHCVSFFIEDPQASLWGSVHLLKENVDSYTLYTKQDEVALSVWLRRPIMHQDTRAQSVELMFSSECHDELEEVLGRVFTKMQKPPRSPAAGGTVRSGRSGLTYKRKRPPSKSPLRVLPLSCPSSEDDSSVSMSVPRSRAEILFDQIRQAPPTSPTIRAEPEASRQQGAELGPNISPIKKATCSSPGGEEPASEEEGLFDQGAWSVAEQWAEPKSDLLSDIPVTLKKLNAELEMHFTDCWDKVEAEIQFSSNKSQHVSSLLTAAHQQRLLLLQMSQSATDQLKKIEDQYRTLNSIHTHVMRFVQSESQRLSLFRDEVLQRLAQWGRSFCPINEEDQPVWSKEGEPEPT